jgi:hypothetical protein
MSLMPIGLVDGGVRQKCRLLEWTLRAVVALPARGLSPTPPSRQVAMCSEQRGWRYQYRIPRVPSATLPAHVGVTCNQECAGALAGFASTVFGTKTTQQWKLVPSPMPLDWSLCKNNKSRPVFFVRPRTRPFDCCSRRDETGLRSAPIHQRACILPRLRLIKRHVEHAARSFRLWGFKAQRIVDLCGALFRPKKRWDTLALAPTRTQRTLKMACKTVRLHTLDLWTCAIHSSHLF